jgi:hypothetical protein
MNMESEQNNLLRETYELAKENNRMLHKMRRNAFLGGILKLLIWTGFIVVPIWLYSVYLAPMVQDVQKTLNEVQGIGANTQGQLNGLGDILKQFESQIRSATGTKK